MRYVCTATGNKAELAQVLSPVEVDCAACPTVAPTAAPTTVAPTVAPTTAAPTVAATVAATAAETPWSTLDYDPTVDSNCRCVGIYAAHRRNSRTAYAQRY